MLSNWIETGWAGLSLSWLGAAVVVQSWRTSAAAGAGRIRQLYAPRRGVRVPPLNGDWLRRHHIESAKHSDNYDGWPWS